jgi:hypothetical protein
MLGIKSRTGKPILKPWKIASTLDELIQGFSKYRCDKTHEHAQCRGTDAKVSEAYSPAFAKIVHRAFRKHVQETAGSMEKLKSLPCLICVESSSRPLPISSLPISSLPHNDRAGNRLPRPDEPEVSGGRDNGPPPPRVGAMASASSGGVSAIVASHEFKRLLQETAAARPGGKPTAPVPAFFTEAAGKPKTQEPSGKPEIQGSASSSSVQLPPELVATCSWLCTSMTSKCQDPLPTWQMVGNL